MCQKEEGELGIWSTYKSERAHTQGGGGRGRGWVGPTQGLKVDMVKEEERGVGNSNSQQQQQQQPTSLLFYFSSFLLPSGFCTLSSPSTPPHSGGWLVGWQRRSPQGEKGRRRKRRGWNRHFFKAWRCPTENNFPQFASFWIYLFIPVT